MKFCYETRKNCRSGSASEVFDNPKENIQENF